MVVAPDPISAMARAIQVPNDSIDKDFLTNRDHRFPGRFSFHHLETDIDNFFNVDSSLDSCNYRFGSLAADLGPIYPHG